ncbi:MAG: PIG-L deacetylase family protein [Patescibacteria group bacterium]
MKKILLVFAHPNDESFAVGGSAAKYARAGWQVDLLCATRGETGAQPPFEKLAGAALGQIRERELAEAGEILGINSITVLDYQDGTLSRQNPGELEDKIFRRMQELSPAVVVTFDTTGAGNHPDHIKVSYATTFAFQKYAAQSAQQGELEPKLYYVCLPESVAGYLREQRVIPPESFGKPWKGVPDKLVSTIIDIKRAAALKKRALRSYRTQTADVARFLGFPKNPLLSQEYFVLRQQGPREVFLGKYDRLTNRF